MIEKREKERKVSERQRKIERDERLERKAGIKY